MPEIISYQRLDGTCPFAAWFESLDSQAAAKITVVIERMVDGNPGDVKAVGEGVWERRIDYGPGYRLYFGRDGNDILLLLTGGTKKRQQADIQEAKILWAEYRKRKRTE